MLNVDLLVLAFCFSLGTEHCAAAKREYQIQNGPCSYTFLLPEQENCQSQSSSGSNYPLQKDGPEYQDESAQRLEQLEMTMENNTQWLLKVKVSSTPLCYGWIKKNTWPSRKTEQYFFLHFILSCCDSMFKFESWKAQKTFLNRCIE